MKNLWFIAIFIMAISCNKREKPDNLHEENLLKPTPDLLETHFITAGLTRVQEVIPEVIVDLKYSTTDNFLHHDVYGDLTQAYLQPDVTQMLKKAYEALQQKDSSLTFIIYDATRPLHIQYKMWEILDMPLEEKGKYLSNPKNGSIHNYGAAVDISLARKSDSVALDMGTPFDFFGPEAEPVQEQVMMKSGKLSAAQYQNRLLLRNAMQAAGFRQLPTEWWHYNACSREEAKKRYDCVE
ncbi:MAG TPA: M15 family metallopeptidase [Chitinophagales bacterium]|nr:M15 family metallopeptidase [Chitinophagales bacterium]